MGPPPLTGYLNLLTLKLNPEYRHLPVTGLVATLLLRWCHRNQVKDQSRFAGTLDLTVRVCRLGQTACILSKVVGSMFRWRLVPVMTTRSKDGIPCHWLVVVWYSWVCRNFNDGATMWEQVDALPMMVRASRLAAAAEPQSDTEACVEVQDIVFVSPTFFKSENAASNSGQWAHASAGEAGGAGGQTQLRRACRQMHSTAGCTDGCQGEAVAVTAGKHRRDTC